MVTIPNGPHGVHAVQPAVTVLTFATDPASIRHRPMVAVTAWVREMRLNSVSLKLCIPRLYPYGTHVRDRQITRNLDRNDCLRINIPGQGLPFRIRQHKRLHEIPSSYFTEKLSRSLWLDITQETVEIYNSSIYQGTQDSSLILWKVLKPTLLTKRLGNTNSHGLWFFRLENSSVLDLPAKKCYTWSSQQASITIPRIRPCPCTFNQAIADKLFYVDYNQIVAGRSNLTTCAYSLPFRTSAWVQQCCYTERPGVGKVLTTGQPEGGSPFLMGIPGLPFMITDLEAHAYCCNSFLCDIYYQHRPSDTCSRYNSRRRGKTIC
ncbi:Protein GPR15L [Desmophyllum pertusum]|uniref:Protein GPR15L n=1 Tax=Desmophyllum pertusum TaxID=174260 RepID=A0A9X0CTM1_9CNID|nr:Protein GPR15L [Desmophyllum pertusum]